MHRTSPGVAMNHEYQEFIQYLKLPDELVDQASKEFVAETAKVLALMVAEYQPRFRDIPLEESALEATSGSVFAVHRSGTGTSWGGFTAGLVDSGGARLPATAERPDGMLVVAYVVGGSEGELKLAVEDGGWTTEVVRSGVRLAEQPAVAYEARANATPRIHVVYSDVGRRAPLSRKRRGLGGLTEPQSGRPGAGRLRGRRPRLP